MLKLRLRMPGVMHFCAFGQQALPTTLPAPCERGAAGLGFHAGTKAMLAFARALGSLVSPFHRFERVRCRLGERLP
jgi:hypothetical protein